METTGTPERVLPTLVRLDSVGVCGCGETVEAGERVGYLSSEDGIVCIDCLAALQAGRLDLVDVLARVRSEVVAEDVEVVHRRLVADRHSRLVSDSADSLVNRFDAIRTMASLEGELQPLEAFVTRRP